MTSPTNIHPDHLLDTLLARPSRSNVKRTLQALHTLCRKHHQAGMRDFSIACIGRQAEEAGLLTYRTLYNPASQVYRDLIQAWGAYAGPPVVIPAKSLASNDYLLRIEDPAIRMIMQSIIAERDRLKAELNMVKGSKLGIIDLRPLGATFHSDPKAGSMAIMMMNAQLTEPERESLLAAISPKFLCEQGWSVGERGEITNVNGRVLFLHGFTWAIKKILGVEHS